jgi:hypothetical protein
VNCVTIEIGETAVAVATPPLQVVSSVSFGVAEISPLIVVELSMIEAFTVAVADPEATPEKMMHP